MAASLLRQRNGTRAQVTSVELFFDLVFVIAVTQISHALLVDLTPLGALHAGLMLLAIWSVWIGTAWITNWLDPQRPLVRLLLFALMGIGLVMTSALPEAFGERGLAFGVALGLFQVGRTLFILWASRSDRSLRRNFIRVIAWYGASALFWIGGGLADGETRLVLWLVALGVDCGGPAAAYWIPMLGRTDTHDWTIEGGHLAERSGLFIMIALGESVLSTGVAFTDSPWTANVVAAMAVSLLGTIGMWWIYFNQNAEVASDAIQASNDPGRVARRAYTYVPSLLIAGVVMSAVGDELALGHAMEPMTIATAVVLIAGPALFLLGAGLFELAVFDRWSKTRFGGLVVLLALLLVSDSLSPLLLAASAVAVLIVTAACESIIAAKKPKRLPAVVQPR